MSFFKTVLAQQSGSNPPVGGQGGSNPPLPGNGIGNPLGSINTIQALIVKILDLVVQIGLPVIVLMIMYAGFKYVTARGDTGKVKEAHQALLWTVVGAAVVLGASVISHAIQATIDSLK